MGNVNLPAELMLESVVSLLTPHGEREQGNPRRDPGIRQAPNPSWGT